MTPEPEVELEGSDGFAWSLRRKCLGPGPEFWRPAWKFMVVTRIRSRGSYNYIVINPEHRTGNLLITTNEPPSAAKHRERAHSPKALLRSTRPGCSIAEMQG